MIALTGGRTSRHPALYGLALALAMLISLVGVHPGQCQEHEEPRWTGAWHWLHESYDGRLILTENWFCGVFSAKDRPPPQGARPTEAEAAALFRSMSGPACGPVNILSTTEHETILETVNEVGAHPASHGFRTRRPHRVEDSKMVGDVLRADGTVRLTHSFQRLSDPGGSALAGAWELVSDEWNGLMLMTDTEYRYVVSRKDRPQIQARSSELTDAEAAVLYHAFDAQGGSYMVSESVMTRRPDVAKDPREQGRETAIQFRLDGETLTIGATDQRWVWRKLARRSPSE